MPLAYSCSPFFGLWYQATAWEHLDGPSCASRFWPVVSATSHSRKSTSLKEITNGSLLDTMVLDSIPSPEYLNTANSAAFSIAAMCRALGPFVLGWLFGVSSTFDAWLPRQLVWIAYLGICAFPIMAARRMEIVSDHSSDYELLQADRGLENGHEDSNSASQVVRQ
jgi:hypothetical protein